MAADLFILKGHNVSEICLTNVIALMNPQMEIHSSVFKKDAFNKRFKLRIHL